MLDHTVLGLFGSVEVVENAFFLGNEPLGEGSERLFEVEGFRGKRFLKLKVKAEFGDHLGHCVAAGEGGDGHDDEGQVVGDGEAEEGKEGLTAQCLAEGSVLDVQKEVKHVVAHREGEEGEEVGGVDEGDEVGALVSADAVLGEELDAEEEKVDA